MDIFDNCRICLEVISHEPIKMTRLILKFIEHGLNYKWVARHFEPTNVKQNLCAVCFNKLAQFQDFHEQCKESDEFWQIKFARDKQNKLEKCMQDIKDDDIKAFDPHAEEEMSKQISDSAPEVSLEYEESELPDEFIQCEATQPGVDTTSPAATTLGDIADPVCEEVDDNQSVESCAGLDEWPDDNEEATEGDLENSSQQQEINQEIIEFEYELEQENAENVELTQLEAPSSTVMETESQADNMAYEYQEVDDSTSCDTILQESFEGVLNIEQTSQEQYDQEFVENTFLQTTAIDDSGKVKKSYQCQHCGRSFDRVYDIESHYNIHCDIKPFVCDVCGRSFRQKNILTTHQALHFGKKIECPECGKKFARRSQLILHFRMHRDEKPFVCDFEGCEAAFRQRQHLVDHSFIHTGEKNFQCASCPKAFHTRKRLQDHLYKVHSSHRYGCDLCDKAFLKPHMLKNHLSNIHNCELNDVSHLKVSIEQLKPSRKSKTRHRMKVSIEQLKPSTKSKV